MNGDDQSKTAQEATPEEEFIDFYIGLTLLGEAGREKYFEHLRRQQSILEAQPEKKVS